MLLNSWLLMMVMHEAGHILCAQLTGGRVAKVVLHPLAISRTFVDPNPRPLVVVWGGPLLGVGGPLLLWGLSARGGLSVAYLLRFFAGFCCVANGVYLGSAVVMPVGDAMLMLLLGCPLWTLLLFGVVTVPLGFWLWHRQGGKFGLGPFPSAVDPGHVRLMVVLLIVIIVVELICCS